MKRLYNISMAVMALALVACEVDDKVTDYSSAISLASSGDIEWAQSDKIGFSVYNASGVTLDNVEFYNAASSGTSCDFYAVSSDNTLYWSDFTKSDVYVAYYPYTQDVADYKLELDLSDQSYYKSHDLLVASGDIASIEEGMEFGHALSMLSVKIETGDEYVAQDLQFLEVEMTTEIATKATYNYLRDVLTIDSAVGKVESIYFDEASSTIQCIVLPQSGLYGVGFTFENSTVGDNAISVLLPDGVIEAGQTYSATATISQNGVSISETTINPWVSTTVAATASDADDAPDYVLADGTFLSNSEGVAYYESDDNLTNPIVGLVYYESDVVGESYAMSIKKNYGYFTNAASQLPTTKDLDDGRVNMDAYLTADPTLEKYPLVKWCHELNSTEVNAYTDQTMVWYIPAQTELNNELFYALIPEFNADDMGLYRDSEGVESFMRMGSMKQGVVNTNCEMENRINIYLSQVGGDIFGEGTPTINASGMEEGYYNLVEYALCRYSVNADYIAGVRYWASNVNGATNPMYIPLTRSSNGTDTTAATGYANGVANAQGHNTQMNIRAVMRF